MNNADKRALDLAMVTVRRLAASPDTQIQYLEKLGTAPSSDELALEFDGFYQPLKPRLNAHGSLSALSNTFQHLDDLLLSFSGQDNAELWTTKALNEAPQWNEVRQAAQRVIDEATAAGLASDD